jgi:hypothetical protein
MKRPFTSRVSEEEEENLFDVFNDMEGSPKKSLKKTTPNV